MSNQFLSSEQMLQKLDNPAKVRRGVKWGQTTFLHPNLDKIFHNTYFTLHLPSQIAQFRSVSRRAVSCTLARKGWSIEIVATA